MTHYDVLVIGSGFGGSVTALRLTEKGDRVGVLETGRRFADDEFAENSWHLREYPAALRLPIHRCDAVSAVANRVPAETIPLR